MKDKHYWKLYLLLSRYQRKLKLTGKAFDAADTLLMKLFPMFARHNAKQQQQPQR